MPATLYDTGPSHHTQPGTREQLLDEKPWQLSFFGRGRSRWEWAAGNVADTSGTLRGTDSLSSASAAQHRSWKSRSDLWLLTVALGGV